MGFSIVEVENTTTKSKATTTEDSKHQKTKQATKDHKNAIRKSTKKQVQNENIGQVRDTENQDYMDQENQDYMDNGVAPLSIQGFSQNNPTSDKSIDKIDLTLTNSMDHDCQPWSPWLGHHIDSCTCGV